MSNEGTRSVLMCIGCYPIQAALIAFNHEEPESIIATGYKAANQGKVTDRMASITLKYSNQRLAVLNCLGESIQPINSLKIHGTAGNRKYIYFEKFSFEIFRCR